MTDVLSNPFFVTVVAGLVTAVVSAWLGGRLGERATANYSISQGRKREHHLALLDKPADELIQKSQAFERSLTISIDYSRPPRSLTSRIFPELAARRGKRS